MSYKTLLVHLDDSRHSNTRAAVALNLARRWDAHLIGLYVVCQDLLRPLFRQDESLRLAVAETQHAEGQQHAQQAFLAAAERAGCHAEFRAPAGAALDVATLHARHADLLVLGQYDPEDQASYIARNFIADLLIAGGRPALVVPHAGAVRTLGENVLIGWDGSRAAARALADALPLLRHARFVSVEIVEGHSRHAAMASTPAGIDVAAYLEQHGVRASFSALPHAIGVSVGATLLNRASDLRADLLVTGAYAHSKAHERVLGGVTRTLLESMTVPVLMSH